MSYNFLTELKDKLFYIKEKDFESISLSLFKYQFENNPIYRNYVELLGININHVNTLLEIPFLPIEFFKSHTIKSESWNSQKQFNSSGTTGERSTHHIKDLNIYLKSAKYHFEKKFGSLKDYQIIALLPSYQEQSNSSLIAMVDYFIEHAQQSSGYFLDETITENNLSKNTILFGVSYALLDLAEKLYSEKDFLIIDTGGMKGRRKEIIREEFLSIVHRSFPKTKIVSEYGMTELLSQAYGESKKLKFPNWAKALIREINDPFDLRLDNASGGINVIDLANMHTCSFIETKDLGKMKNYQLEVLGRLDNSDIRGCNLLI